MQTLHMNAGSGETSYAKNSWVQSNIISAGKRITEEAILDMLSNHLSADSIGIGDLGCSSGPNTLLVISEILNVIYAKWCLQGCGSSPEFRVYLNDLTTNDFNNVFGSLPAFYTKLKEEKGSGFGPCFIVGMPGSFYGRLFPTKSMHFVHSSSSLHWLSQVPPGLDSKATTHLNRGKIYISKTSPLCVLEAYLIQFQKDFSLFLKSRSEEIVPKGRMVLSFMGRRSPDPAADESCYQFELLARALMSMVSEGLVEEEKADSFNLPYYTPSPEEVEFEIQKEGSFILDRLETFEIDWINGNDGNSSVSEGVYPTSEALSRGHGHSKGIRAVVESMLEFHFGGHIMDDLFTRYGDIVDEHLSKTTPKYIVLVISLVKKG
ncbi:jasmonate O-methyltransferase-like [Vitis riparia]|uniref:jasmonate O-methyltransferase-like n=1 Tax=Vitis riparia TaxID=96939 RepID=UPI00155AB850|nr:jasmonate O-methyltransferase-like [Vitis riparia]